MGNDWMRDVEQAHKDYLNDPARLEFVARVAELEAALAEAVDLVRRMQVKLTAHDIHLVREAERFLSERYYG